MNAEKIYMLFLWGGSNGEGTTAISALNTKLMSILVAAGAILIAIGVMNMIVALHEQSSSSKAKAAMMIGLGILFMGTSTLLSTLGLNNPGESTSENEVVINALTVMGTGLKWAGIALAGIAIFQFVMAMANEDAREKADGTKMLGTGIALYAGETIMKEIGKMIIQDNSTQETVAGYVLGVIVFFARYVGIGFAGIGIFQFVLAMKDGDGAGKAKAAIFVSSGAAMIALKPLFNAIF